MVEKKRRGEGEERRRRKSKTVALCVALLACTQSEQSDAKKRKERLQVGLNESRGQSESCCRTKKTWTAPKKGCARHRDSLARARMPGGRGGKGEREGR